MPGWLNRALDYIPEWLGFQMRMSEQPGCIVAIAQRGRVVLERAWGVADPRTGERLTPRHRFRVASRFSSRTSPSRC
jgi:CubicO group peptidase (beta-lactamase class C family)